MAAPLHASRRTVLVAAAGAAAGAAAPALARAAQDLEAVAVFEADEPNARAFAQGRAARGLAALAVDGDRVRFARQLFGAMRPPRVVAMTRYADYLLLAESAREEGYRTALAGQAPPNGAALFAWTAELS